MRQVFKKMKLMTTTIVIIALSVLCLLSIGANIVMYKERRNDRLDKEYLIKQGAAVELRLVQLEEECKTERGKFGWAVAALKEAQSSNTSL